MERLRIDLSKYSERSAIIYLKSDKTIQEIKYDQLHIESSKVALVLNDSPIQASASIGILCGRNPTSIALLLGIMEAGCGFCFISTSEVSDDLHKLGIKQFFSDEIFDDYADLRNSLEVFGRKIYLYTTRCTKEIQLFQDLNDSTNRICYTVSTSGSTGKKKIVRVTFNSIASNIFALQKIFELSSETDKQDVVMSSAPIFFDVFVLDLFLSLHSGSSMLIIDDSLRYSEFFFDTIAKSVTFMEITPSVFQRFGSENIKNKILHPRSSLKFLVLGGEKFPSPKEVFTWQNWDSESRKRIFNIYGTTEMSCWAMIHEVSKEDLLSGNVPLGKLLDDTSCGFLPDPHNENEEIFLISQKRVCFIDEDNLKAAFEAGISFAHNTGDLVRRLDNKIFYHGRKNNIIVKRFGEKVNMNIIENIALEVVSEVACVHFRKNVILFVKMVDDVLVNKLSKLIDMKLKPSERPDEIRKIDFFPLSINGKISKSRLKEVYKAILLKDRARRIEAEETFLEAINQIFNLKLSKPVSVNSDEPDFNFKKQRTEIDQTFKSLGGSSFDAMKISMKLEKQTNLLPRLLADRDSIREICYFLRKTNMGPQESNFSASQVERRKDSRGKTFQNCEIIRNVNLSRCVDSTPAFIQTQHKSLVVVGSHSGAVVTIDANSLKEISRIILDDRVQSEVSFFNQDAIVGCYDGFLYCFNPLTGKILWKFSSGGMIKCRALVHKNFLIFGNYNEDKNLWCLELTDSSQQPVLKWNRMVAENGLSRAILVDPLLITDESVLICTLAGTVQLVNVFDGTKIWSKALDTPVFSNPQKIPNREAFLVAEVSRMIHCIDFKGNSIWKFQTEGNIFSSFLFAPNGEAPNEVLIVFGCHDKKLRCLNYNFEKASVKLDWHLELQSEIFSSPKLAEIDSNTFVVCCTTDGHIDFVRLSDGTNLNSLKVSGEIFSTPVIFGRKIFVGCRDNFLYCIKF